MTARCPSCLKPMPAERKAVGYSKCMACTPQIVLKGANIYGHKTAGACEVMRAETYAVYKRVTARKAKGTHGPSFQRGTTAVFYHE